MVGPGPDWLLSARPYRRGSLRENTEEKVYVQQRVRENAELLWDLIANRSACFYIAGNAKDMPSSVCDALKEVFQQGGSVLRGGRADAGHHGEYGSIPERDLVLKTSPQNHPSSASIQTVLHRTVNDVQVSAHAAVHIVGNHALVRHIVLDDDQAVWPQGFLTTLQEIHQVVVCQGKDYL
ncbi:hypothetical protein F7725_015186 [Dissostichus mawsoni]|uniref:Uncharacterized protein n=1 Tax=Dissostichus mawsoni TaxID=36200 RepID=A0A7J5YIS5_DISMA|nr:hypothetical protein F7725_015186 [Dissostichus mawsoni]